MEFKLIKNNNDIQDLMNEFLCFHDSCITEIHYISGSYVMDDRSMHPLNSQRIFSIKFQSQIAKFKTLELKFSKVVQCYLNPKNEEYDSIILGSYFQKKDNLFYWADCEDFSIKNKMDCDCTWIIAESVSWRMIKEL